MKSRICAISMKKICEPVTVDDSDFVKELADRSDALNSGKSMNYSGWRSHEKEPRVSDKRHHIRMRHTFLKKADLVVGGAIYVGHLRDPFRLSRILRNNETM